MRLRGRQLQFLLTILLCWSAVRAYLLWPTPKAPDVAQLLPRSKAPIRPTVPIQPPKTPIAVVVRSSTVSRDGIIAKPAARAPTTRLAMLPVSSVERGPSPFAGPPVPEGPAPPAPAALAPASGSSKRRIEAQAYLFVRPGGGTASLAARGELGGSQVAARIAMPLGRRFAVAARVYAPLARRGAEGAIGIDWHPLPAVPLRISIERRQRIDTLGRSAWSAYAAGGFYRGGGPGTAQVDGYAQAGIVGVERRDGFVDGALRLGYRLPTRRVSITAGAGLWGAAQPGVSRVDAGPHLAITAPVQGHSLTLAVDGRLRMVGHAAPGSGIAMTLAADF